MLENIKFQTNGPFLKTTKIFQPFFSGVSRENALKKAPNSAQIPWLDGHFYGSRPNKYGATMPQGIPSTKPRSYFGSSCACYISRYSSVSRTFLDEKLKFSKFSNFKKFLIKILRYRICLLVYVL